MFALDHRDGTIINILEKIEQISFLNSFSGNPCAQRNRRYVSARQKHIFKHHIKPFLVGIYKNGDVCALINNKEYKIIRII